MGEPRFFATSYDRSQCSTGVVHVGFGAFHRAHQAVFIDDYMNKTGDLRWGIAAVNLRASESGAFADASKPTDGYLLKTISPDGTQEFRKVRSHLEFWDASKDMDAATALLARTTVSVVTITITESGYAFDENWALNLKDPGVAADLSGETPSTLYGFLARGLSKRQKAGGAPISILCCDNIRSNGRVLERAFEAYLAASRQEELLDWVRGHVSFPCSMVDRITPRSSPELLSEVNQLFPTEAISPIQAEAYLQWVLEEAFAGPMPDLAQAGVQIVADVEPFEEAKIRILNGGHTCLAYLGAVSGHETFDAAIRDPALRAHYDRWERDEVLPGLGGDIPFDLPSYLADVTHRFENEGIADQLERICMDGYSKMGLYIRPTLEACLTQGIQPNAGYDSIASWVVFARHAAAGRSNIPYHEPFWEGLAPMLAYGREEALARDPQLWGDLPKRFPNFTPDLTAAIKRMDAQWPA
ncbi:MAG: mannitol dehydrogenase family protein [Pseudomonadota bacterium]